MRNGDETCDDVFQARNFRGICWNSAQYNLVRVFRKAAGNSVHWFKCMTEPCKAKNSGTLNNLTCLLYRRRYLKQNQCLNPILTVVD